MNFPVAAVAVVVVAGVVLLRLHELQREQQRGEMAACLPVEDFAAFFEFIFFFVKMYFLIVFQFFCLDLKLLYCTSITIVIKRIITTVNYKSSFGFTSKRGFVVTVQVRGAVTFS